MIEIEASLPPSHAQQASRSVVRAIARGFRQRCPACAGASLYRRYLKTVDRCETCGEELHHHRADDAPPYFTILIVGHLVVGGMLVLETSYAPPTGVHLALWLPLLVVMSLWLLPRVKGALIGLQWALRMHGFGGEADSLADPSRPDDL